MDQLKSNYEETAATLRQFASNMPDTDPRVLTLNSAAWQCEMIGQGAHTVEPSVTPVEFLIGHFSSSLSLRKTGLEARDLFAEALDIGHKKEGRIIDLHNKIPVARLGS